MSNLANMATATLVISDHSRFELESFSLKNYAINSLYSLQVTVMDEFPDEVIGLLAWVEWVNREDTVYFSGILSSVEGKIGVLEAPFALDSLQKTRYFHQRPLTEVIKKLMEDFRCDSHIQADPSRMCDFAQQNSMNSKSLLEVLNRESAYCVWRTSRSPQVLIQTELKAPANHPFVFGKYGIESTEKNTVWCWREYPRLQHWELETQNWLGDLGDSISHPQLGTLRIIAIALQKSRSQNPAITITACPMDHIIPNVHIKRQVLPLSFAKIHQTVDEFGHYQTCAEHGEEDAFTRIPAVTLRNKGWHFPYRFDETVVQQYVDRSETPVIMGSMMSKPLSSTQLLKTSSGLSFRMDDEEGIALLTSEHSIQLCPKRIVFSQSQGELHRRASRSNITRVSDKMTISVAQDYSQIQKQCWMTYNTAAVKSGQHLFCTAEDISITTLNQAEWTVGHHAILHARHVSWRIPQLTVRGNFHSQAKTIVIQTESFELKAGGVTLRLDQDGFSVNARKIQCSARKLEQTGLQSLFH